MDNQYKLVEFEQYQILKEIEEAFWDIPFENSAFQTETFVLAAGITPERMYRQLGLKIHEKLTALKNFYYARAQEDIDIEELQHEINQNGISKFDKRRKELKIQAMLDARPWADKLKNDAIQELNVLYSHFKKMPRYNRQQFESAERTYFEQSMHRKIKGIEGPVEALVNMNDDITALEEFEQAVLSLPENERTVEKLQSLSAQLMTNKIVIKNDTDE
jgi:hypothetical protein